MKKTKTARQMERHLKGIANHHRIDILLLLADESGLSLDQIVERLKANEKTIGEHTRRLQVAGLINKQHKGKFVEHMLTPYGEAFVKFLQTFQQS